MEGLFLKKLRGIKEQAEIEEQQKLEAKLPSPPGMGIIDITEATQCIVSYMENSIIEYVEEDPLNSYGIDFSISESRVNIQNIYIYRPEKRYFGNGSTWWSGICDWAELHFPNANSDIEYVKRYHHLTMECFRHVLNMWNTTHPDIPGKLSDVDYNQTISIPFLLYRTK